MIFQRLLAPLILLSLLPCSCTISKQALDKKIIKNTAKRTAAIKELADFSIAYATDIKKNKFLIDTLTDLKIKKKFNSYGCGGLVTVTFRYASKDIIHDLIDSTVIFRQLSIRGVTEIIYDFAAVKKKYEDQRANPYQSVFINVTDRIFYRRSQIPMM